MLHTKAGVEVEHLHIMHSRDTKENKWYIEKRGGGCRPCSSISIAYSRHEAETKPSDRYPFFVEDVPFVELMCPAFTGGVNISTTRSFPRADTGSHSDLLMMTFHFRVKRIGKPKHTRLKFDLEKLKDPNVFETFHAMIGGTFAPLIIMNNEDADLDLMITTFNTAVTETASEILGKHRRKTPGSLQKFLICATEGEN